MLSSWGALRATVSCVASHSSLTLQCIKYGFLPWAGALKRPYGQSPAWLYFQECVSRASGFYFPLGENNWVAHACFYVLVAKTNPISHSRCPVEEIVHLKCLHTGICISLLRS